MADMSTQVMPTVSPAFEKAATGATQALAVMYKEAHKMEPDSPMCQALMQLQSAVAEIEGSAGNAPMDPGMDPAAQGMDPNAPPPDAGMEDPAAAPGGTAEVPPPPSASTGNPFADAAQGTKDDMLAAAKKRAGA